MGLIVYVLNNWGMYWIALFLMSATSLGMVVHHNRSEHEGFA